VEGAYEQIDKRLESVEHRMENGFAELRTRVGHVDHRIDGLEQRLSQKIDTTCRWVIGVVLINWITVMLAIFNKH